MIWHEVLVCPDVVHSHICEIGLNQFLFFRPGAPDTGLYVGPECHRRKPITPIFITSSLLKSDHNINVELVMHCYSFLPALLSVQCNT